MEWMELLKDCTYNSQFNNDQTNLPHRYAVRNIVQLELVRRNHVR